MTAGLATAGSGQSWESALVGALDRGATPLTVVRRCVDVADLLAVASTGQIAVAAVAADLRRLDSEVVDELHRLGVAVVAVRSAADDRIAVRLQRIGIAAVVPDDQDGADLVTILLRERDRQRLAARGEQPGTGGAQVSDRMLDPATGGASTVGSDAGSADGAAGPTPRSGRVVAVWGPAGAPGRSTVASGLAGAAAEAGARTVLVDADVYGGVQASAFGLLDESPGLAGACRLAANGRLDLAGLVGLCWQLTPELRLLTGISRADRWPELRPSTMPVVLDGCRQLADLTVLDCGFCLEDDPELSFDTLAPRRNGATLAALTAADEIVVVGSADPAGMERLVRGLAELREAVPGGSLRVVLNRCRPTAARTDDAVEALHRFAGVRVAARLPEDRDATDRAWRAGIGLVEAAPSSPLRRSLTELAASMLGGAVRGDGGRSRRRPVPRGRAAG
ncbi:AAA family ATPase [Nakamurella leprariae]|uniref:Chromosome partitioning protein n=1 Tax=Nakamurella leprariae TaxID=2803911 RepID=A0A938Y9A0_9ACTN|nr:chromosome partitioning protein [Nakamurella leprariae]MBM9468210.1 chromosome partitioning protein [Nakamurella leprariae]